MDITVIPLELDDEPAGNLVSLVDVTRHHELQEELEQTHRELEVAYEELQSANEELETTNEELQSTVEELETTNEELQSTNEELETMNEELSSTNEELHAINVELGERSAEADRLNAYFESVLTVLQASVVVVDTDLLVRVWNGQSSEMWGIRPDEAEGRPLLALDIGLPLEPLHQPLADALAGRALEQPLTIEAITRRGRTVECLVRINPVARSDGRVDGAIVIVEELPGND